MSVNDFNRGTESQARAHYAVMRKQGEATAELGKRIIQKIDTQGNITEVLIDANIQQEMEQKFGVSRTIKVGELDDSDRIKLLAYLKALLVHRGQNTQFQCAFYDNIRQYFNIEDVADSMDLLSVSNLDVTQSELKAFLKCVFEFLFLKEGSRRFVDEFVCEIDAFGLSNRIIDEILTSIETTYEFFGIRGLVEHYALASIPQEKAQSEELRIPFFEKAFAIIYDGKEKHHGEYAEMLKATIEERLDAIGVEKPQIRIEDENKLEGKIRTLEETRHLIFVGEPKLAKDLVAVIKRNWEFDRFGMKFGTSGEKSIIDVEELKKKDRKAFAEYVKQNASRWESEASKTVRLLEKSFFDDAFEDPNEVGKGEAFFVNTLATAIGWPLLLAGGVIDMFSNAELKENLLKFQYFVAIDNFILSKISPHIDVR